MNAMYSAFVVIVMIGVAAGITLDRVGPTTAQETLSGASVRLD